jgi:hypothetical protein
MNSTSLYHVVLFVCFASFFPESLLLPLSISVYTHTHTHTASVKKNILVIFYFGSHFFILPQEQPSKELI